MTKTVAEKVIIVKLKTVRYIAKAHEVRPANYWVTTQTNVGVTGNFGDKEAEAKTQSGT